MLYLDLPTHDDLLHLAAERSDIAVSIFLPTTPLTPDLDADSVLLKRLAGEVQARLQARGADPERVRALMEELADLIVDREYWCCQARGLAIYATPDNLRTFRVPDILQARVQVCNRFHLAPLLRAVTFSDACYVLAFAESGARLIEVSPDLPARPVRLPGMPDDTAPLPGQGGDEDKRVLLRQFARKVDGALRGLLSGSDVPLVLAAIEALAGIYRSVNTYSHLVPQGVTRDPETLSDADLAAAAAGVLETLYQDQIARWTAQYQQRIDSGRATNDTAEVARAATYGLVQSLLLDIDQPVSGVLDEIDGTLSSVGPDAGPAVDEVTDEIARRVLVSGGQVLCVRTRDVPGGRPLAAILRHPL
jgi:hypothetical protein